MSSGGPDVRGRVPAGRGRGRRTAVLAGCLVVVGIGAWALWPEPAVPAASRADVPVGVARVVRTDVAERQVVPGTLDYRGGTTVLDELPEGIVTWTPSPGSVVRRGGTLFRVANKPVELLTGGIPAWRSFEIGMAPGPDVRELEANIEALALDPTHAITVDDHFTWFTAAAIERWQRKLGMAATGSLPLGEVVFLPEAVRVAGVAAPTGTPVAPGAPVFHVTSTVPAVSVSMPVGEAVVRPRDQVIVTLPDGNTTVGGVVAAVGRVATAPGSDSQGGSQGPATIPVTILLDSSRSLSGLDQAPVQVAITDVEHRGVLAVPVTALLARASGGYAVQLSSGAHRLVPVTTGLFDDSTGLVEVSGRGLTPGTTLEVAAG